MRIALFQPDIPQNTGNIIRLAACLDVAVDIIKPTGFFLDDKKFTSTILPTKCPLLKTGIPNLILALLPLFIIAELR